MTIDIGDLEGTAIFWYPPAGAFDHEVGKVTIIIHHLTKIAMVFDGDWKIDAEENCDGFFECFRFFLPLFSSFGREDFPMEMKMIVKEVMMDEYRENDPILPSDPIHWVKPPPQLAESLEEPDD